MVKKPSCQPNVTSQLHRRTPLSDTATGTENLERHSYRQSKCQSCHQGQYFEYSEKLVAKWKEVIQREMSGGCRSKGGKLVSAVGQMLQKSISGNIWKSVGCSCCKIFFYVVQGHLIHVLKK